MPKLIKGSACCVAVGCNMRAGTNLLSNVKMFKFPMDPLRRRMWECAVRRDKWNSTKHSCLCSKHFISGKPSKDAKHPDYVPSVFLYSSQPEGTMERNEKAVKRNKVSRQKVESASFLKCNSKIMLPSLKRGTSCCSAVDCSMRSKTNLLSKIKLYCFPADPIRRQLWKIAVRRDNWEPKKGSKLCSLHFISGQPSKDPEHPDYVPSIFSYNTRSVSIKEVERYNRRKRRRVEQEGSLAGIKEFQDSVQNDFSPTVFCWNDGTKNIKVNDCKTKSIQKESNTASYNDIYKEDETDNEDLETLHLQYMALENEKQELENKLKKISEISLT